MATKGTVSGVIANMVTLVVDGPVAQNEICYISTGGDRLMAEVIKVVGTQVYVQVFESTRGLKVGAEAEFTGHMLEVTLGPGMLSKNYDGLQNDLDKMDGVFLKRGQYTYPLDKGSKWHFVPLAKVGDQVEAAAWLEGKGLQILERNYRCKKGEIDLIANLDCVVSMDSLVMHLASLMATPTVSVWGATHPGLGFLGYGFGQEGVLQTDFACRPCSVYGKKPCKYGDYRCIWSIEPQMILDRVERLVGKTE